jgi:hypothetical protein
MHATAKAFVSTEADDGIFALRDRNNMRKGSVILLSNHLRAHAADLGVSINGTRPQDGPYMLLNLQLKVCM